MMKTPPYQTVALILLVATAIACSKPATEQKTDPYATLKSELAAAVKKNFENFKIPGVLVGVWVPGKFEFKDKIGVSDTKTKEPMGYDQHFRIGSVTKTFTNTLIFQLAAEGKLSLEDPVSKYFEGVPNGDQIKLKNLSNMTSGLANYTFDPEFQDKLFKNPNSVWKPQDLVEIGFKNTKAGCPHAKKACFAAGTDWFYCNTNTVMLGMIAEKVSGKKYGELIEAKITKPLKLKNTSHPSSPKMPSPYAHGYTKQGLPDDAKTRQDSTHWNPSWGFAVGDLISNLEDLHQWGIDVAKGTLLSKKAQKQRLTKVTVGPNTPERAYAMGIGFKNGWWGHGGELPGYNSLTFYRPDIGASIVVMVNSDLIDYKGKEIHPAYVIADDIMEILGRAFPAKQ